MAAAHRWRLYAVAHESAGDGFEDGGAGIGGVGEAEAAEFNHAGANGREGRNRLLAGKPGCRGKGNAPKRTPPEGQRADSQVGRGTE